MTPRKFFPNFSAILAGKTMMVETNNDPAAGIIKAIATPVTTLNKMDMVRTG
ncbi:hypothetical protein Q604_UNBC18192G0001, partial [human gut metagenome]